MNYFLFYILAAFVTFIGVNRIYEYFDLDISRDYFRDTVHFFNVEEVIIFLGILTQVLLLLFYEKFKGNNSSLERLKARNKNEKVDLFYLFLSLSGLKHILTILFSFGLIKTFQTYINKEFDIALLKEVNWFIGLFILCFVNTFLFYVVHRIMHSRLFWKLHTIHHSATELNVITSFRNHPIDNIIVIFISALPLAILGADSLQLMIYMGLNGLYQLSVHANIIWSNKFLCAIFITPQEHLLHHAKDEKYWNTNFGILKIWDQLFGTYMKSSVSENKKIALGLDEMKSMEYYQKIFRITYDWIMKK